MTKELYLLVNAEPNTRFANTHEDLTIVNKPEMPDESAIYQLNEREQVKEDLEWHRQEHGDHIEARKITIEEANLEEEE